MSLLYRTSVEFKVLFYYVFAIGNANTKANASAKANSPDAHARGALIGTDLAPSDP